MQIIMHLKLLADAFQEQIMQQYLIAIALIMVGGILAPVIRKHRDVSNIVGAGSAIIGALLALLPVLKVLFSGTDFPVLLLSLPLGEASLKLDAVSAFFALPVLVLLPVTALFSGAVARQEKYGADGYWFFFNTLGAAMLLLLIAANGVVFLVAWEIMSVAAFFLITHRDEIATARSAGWRFLVASHIGTAALMLLFALLAASSGSLEFSQFAVAHFSTGMGSLAFFLALFGFGVKVGLLPLHVWMPDSYTYADAPVSALLSGAMSKMGFYGLLRVLMLLPAPAASWGWVLVIGGLLTGIFAMITALAQSD
ncbi:MAG TPA: hypothetical protein DCG57_01690, partial [Candidatus Riflebacteria bacterium]|nr:hypothetical protein [Candidatus Riflebacteria bacterium]